jgi:Tfp pilus assembly protein PilF
LLAWERGETRTAFAEAEVEARAALQEQQRLVDEYPDNLDYRYELAKSHNNLGTFLACQDKETESEAEYRVALEQQRRLADEYPNVPKYRHYLARTLMDMGGRAEEREATIRAALKEQWRVVGEHPYVPEYRNCLFDYLGALVHLLTRQGKQVEAEGECREAIRLKPDASEPHVLFGELLAERGQWEKAEGEYREAIRLDPKNAVSWNARGGFYHGRQEYAKALADFTRAIELKPDFPEARRNRTLVFADLGQWDKVSADYSKATEFDPGDPWPRYYRALVHLQLGDRGGFRKACAAMRQHFAASGNPGAVYLTAWTCIQVRDAVDDWTPLAQWAGKPLAADPKKCDWLTALGAVLYRAGRFEEAAQRLAEAEAAFRSAKAPASTIAYTWLFLAMTRERLGQTEQARQWLAKAVREIEQPPAGRAKDPNARTWNRKLTLQLLRGEAEALIDRADPKAHREGSTDTEKKP